MHGSWCSEGSANHWKTHGVWAFIKLDSPQEYPACVMQIQAPTPTKTSIDLKQHPAHSIRLIFSICVNKNTLIYCCQMFFKTFKNNVLV